MRHLYFRPAALFLSVFVATAGSQARQADFNEVGRTVITMLQDGHFTGLPFNRETNQRFLNDYLTHLDPDRVYFTKGDVERLHARYDDVFFKLLFQKKSVEVSHDIYAAFRTRVAARGEMIRQYLKTDPDLNAHETAAATRKAATWPTDDAEADSLLRRQIKEAVISEILLRELQVKLAKDAGKPDPTRSEPPAREKVALRYERILRSVKDAGMEDIVGGMLQAIAQSYDPHTDYMIEREASRFTESLRNQLVGVGAELVAEDDGTTRITGIIVGGPADKQGGLQLDDRILAVDVNNTGTFTDVRFMDRDKVVDMVLGKAGTTVRLQVQPAGNAAGDLRIVTIARAQVDLKEDQASAGIVDLKPAEGPPRRIGWITLPSFYDDFEEETTRCSIDVERLLKKLVEAKIDGLIFDVRDNGGGSVDEVCRITGFFIGRGPVAQEKSKRGKVETLPSLVQKPLYSGPMVVLTNKNSASASEIFAGALQDYNRAVIVGGAATYGKGTVQETEDVSDVLPTFAAHDAAGMLKLTVQKFYRPSGSSTQLNGVASDIVLPSPSESDDEEIEKILPHAFPHDRINPAGGFNPLNKAGLFLSQLKERSAQRIQDDRDFSYFTEDAKRDAEEQKRNTLSLNLDERRKEFLDQESRLTARDNERRERFKAVVEQDAKTLKLSKLTLDDIASGAGFHSYDPSKDHETYVRRSKDPLDELNNIPDWPNGLDPVKREGVMIMKDLIELTGTAGVAGLPPKATPIQ